MKIYMMTLTDKEIGVKSTIDVIDGKVVVKGRLSNIVLYYLSNAYGYGGHLLKPESTTEFDVFYALSEHPVWQIEGDIKGAPNLPQGVQS